MNNDILNYLYNQRWCNFKQEIQNNNIKDISFESTFFDNNQKRLVIGKVELENQETRYFMMPLAKANENSEFETITLDNETYCDAVQKDDFWASLIKYIQESNNNITFPNGWVMQYNNFTNDQIIEENKNSKSKPLNVEQSNSTIVVGDKKIAFKLERMLSFLSSDNPELEMNKKLMSEKSNVMPQTYGYLTLQNNLGETSSSGIIQEFIPNKGDLWNYSVNYLVDKLQHSYLNQTPIKHNDCSEFINLMKLLGNKTNQMSECLSRKDESEAFNPEIVSPKFIRDYEKQLSVLLYQTHRNILNNLETLPSDSKKKAKKLIDNWQELTNNFVQENIKSIITAENPGYICRVHGDFHLGQVMVSKNNDLRFIDFAGEPGIPIEQRKQKHIYIRDHAGMYRSIQGYLGSVVAEEFASRAKEPELIKERKDYAQKAIAPIINNASKAFLGERSVKEPWLALEILRKNLYEVNYEVCNRPQMAYVPINDLSSLLKTYGKTYQKDKSNTK